MPDANRLFCNIMLSQSKLDLTGRELKHFNRHASAMRMSSFKGWWLFEWSKAGEDGRTFRVEVQADNRSHAKAQGIERWLEKAAPTIRAKGGLPE